MKKILILLFVTLFPILVFSQNTNPKIEKNIYGFIKNDMFWDSRQTVNAREGHFLLFPSAVSLDADGKDINAVSNFNFLSIQSRVGLKVTGGEALNAKITGIIEADFFGQANDNINLLRLRHAYFKMNWKSTELLFGQYWVPMFITGCFPGTVSFNTGVPFQPFGRNPQVRFTQKIGNFHFVAIANSQRDYVSRGAAGVTGTYLRNSSIPEFSGQLFFYNNNVDKKTEFLIGGGASYKSIVPEIVTASNYVTAESVDGFNAIAFMKIKLSSFTFKTEGIYGQNIPDVLSIGGFGVASIDTVKGYKTYSPLNTMSAWTDLSLELGNFEIGAFGGYSKILGANKEIIGDIYGLGTNIESIYRVSPRITYKVNSVKFAFETEYTVANYGSSRDNFGIPTNLTKATNLRFLFAAYYFF
ncbi:MAG: hypothetical protein JXR68_09965 [Bacteroidales bacterium]|nr:hypothetical protein [Bacteroidales bacterium]